MGILRVLWLLPSGQAGWARGKKGKLVVGGFKMESRLWRMLFIRYRACLFAARALWLSCFAYLIFACCIPAASAQMSATDDAWLEHFVSTDVLTTAGALPFHAILEIASDGDSSTEHHGRIEVFRAEPAKYFLKVETPNSGRPSLSMATVSRKRTGETFIQAGCRILSAPCLIRWCTPRTCVVIPIPAPTFQLPPPTASSAMIAVMALPMS